MYKAITLLRGLVRDTAGNVLPLAAIGMVVAAAIVGSAVDMSQAYRVQSRLQAACDAAVLAGRHAVTTSGFDAAATTTANNYFYTNFSDSVEKTSGTTFTPSSDDNGVTVKASASTIYSTAIMRLFGFMTFPLSASCTSSMGMGNADVMMVLDTTGSMDSALGSTTRIQALRNAMNNFYSTVSTATKGSNARVRYGFVPFSTTVNVGHLLYDLDPSYLADSPTYQTREATFIDYSKASSSSSNPVYQNNQTSFWTSYNGTKYNNSSSCAAARPPNDTTYSNNGSASSTTSSSVNSSGQVVVTITSTQPQAKASYQCAQQGNKYLVQVQYQTRDAVSSTIYTGATYTKVPTSSTIFGFWTYAALSRDTSVYKTFQPVSTYTGDNGTAVSSTWEGCILERQTVNTSSTFSYSSVTGISPSGALDLDIDSAPTSDPKTKWSPLWPEVSYVRHSTYNPTLSSTTDGDPVSSACPVAAQQLQEMDATSFADYANSLSAGGNTYLDIGMIWGSRLLSPSGIFQSNVNQKPSNGAEVSRHLIFMTDGFMEPNISVLQAWGIEWWDRKVTTDGSTNDAARHSSRFRAVCDAIKAKGIRVWVIAFTSALSSDLTYCASDDSSFVATDATGLNTAFQQIAKKVGELRVTS